MSAGSPTDTKCAKNNKGTCSLRQAIADANSDAGHIDGILVPSGTHVSLGSQGPIVFSNSALVDGTGATVSGSGQGFVFGEVVKNLPVPMLQIEGLTISGGIAGAQSNGEGGGINCSSGDMILDHVTVTNNAAEIANTVGGMGGGIWQSDECPMWLDYTTVTHNDASGGGLPTAQAHRVRLG